MNTRRIVADRPQHISVLCFVSISLLLFCPMLRADSYDNMRAQWTAMQVGSSNDLSDPNVAAAVTATAANANSYWSSMNTSSGRTYLWSDISDYTVSANITSTYDRLEAMAFAYAEPGNSLQGNASLATAITGGLDWMYTNYYNQNEAMYGNWWDWEIGSAQASMTTALLVYSQLTSAEIANYTAAIDYFDPNPVYWYEPNGTAVLDTGANLTDVCLAVILRGILGKNSTSITTAENDLDPVFLYVTSGDGFYSDGSFIQHTYIAYTGGYGTTLLGDVANLFLLLNTSAWPITDSNASNVWNWAVQSYVPLMFNGAMNDSVIGRGISVCSNWDHATGRAVIIDLLRLSYGLSASQTAYLQGLIKTWVTNDTTWNGYTNPCNGPGSTTADPVSTTYTSFYTNLSVYDIPNLESIMSNTAIAAVTPSTGNTYFYNMQRVTHALSGYTFDLSLFSNKISAFECGNGTNVEGWYTGLGMTYLNNADLEQYDNNYWATVNMTRLSGVTTDNSTETPVCNFEAYLNTYPWVGGSSVDGLYGSTGMQFTLAPVTGSTLNGQKSWFWFGDKMVALGVGINSTSPGAVETIVENRKLDADGDNALVVNGTSEPTTLGWSSTLSNVSWAYLDGGSVADAGIGYYFPGTANLYALRESRTGEWSIINPGTSTTAAGPSTPFTNNFLSLAFEHGTTPVDAGYAYVVLPNQTAASMAAYAANPDVTVLENSTSAQAVYDAATQTTGANFWGTTSHTVNNSSGPYLTSSTQASVTVTDTGTELDIAVSDPTQENTGTINLILARTATSIISQDSQVAVTQLTPTINLSVNVNGAGGQSFQVKLAESTPPSSTYVVTPSAGANGAISPATPQTVAVNLQPAFTLTPTPGYVPVMSGTCGGTLNATGTTYITAPVTANCTVIANFTPGSYTVTPVVSGGNGTISPNTTQTFSYGATTSFVLTPNAFHTVGSVTDNCGAGGGSSGGTFNSSTNTYVTGPIQVSCTVTATFVVQPDTTIMEPTADSFTRDGTYATTNYGTASYLAVDDSGTGYDRETYLQFTLPAESIASAKLLLYGNASTNTSVTVNIYGTSTSWTQAGITWDNAPAASTSLVGSFTFNGTAAYQEADITSYVQSLPSGSVVSLVLECSAAQYVSFNSASATTNPPELVVVKTPVTTTLSPTADSFVRDGTYANTNYGTASYLAVDDSGTGYDRETYLQFTLPSGSIATGTLQMYGSNTDNNTSITLSVYGTSTSWTETGITWNNAPAASTGVVGSLTVNGTAGYQQANITSYLQSLPSGSVVSLVIENDGGPADYVNFNSSRAASNPPELVITQ